MGDFFYLGVGGWMGRAWEEFVLKPYHKAKPIEHSERWRKNCREETK